MSIATTLVFALALCAGDVTSKTAEQPVELGRVSFEVDFERALARAKTEQKPVFLLFQEIPGCATCKSFGTGPLSHPLLVEAIENEFVPCVVQNNRGGRDREVLERFGEPAWNNPVVRFVDAQGADLIPRADGVWSTGGIAARMADVLERSGRSREWVALVARENASGAMSRAAFAMHCYWQGQAALGALDDVVAVKPGFLEGHEVVEVNFRGGAETLARIAERAVELDCALAAWAEPGAELEAIKPRLGDRARPFTRALGPAKPDEFLYHLQRSPLRLAPLTPLQAVRVNAALGLGRDPSRFLSPRQRELARRIESALAKEAHAFDAVTRPASVEALAEYERQLRERLAR